MSLIPPDQRAAARRVEPWYAKIEGFFVTRSIFQHENEAEIQIDPSAPDG